MDEELNLFEAEDDAVMSGEITVSFLPLKMTCEAHC